jgi:hypothetical protein
MKKSELQQIIREEISKTLNESPNLDMINRSLNILDKAADMAIKNPTEKMKGRPKQIDDTIPEYKVLVTDTIKYFYRNGIMVGSEILDDPYSPFTKLEKLAKKLDKLKEPVYINGRKKRITKEIQISYRKNPR